MPFVGVLALINCQSINTVPVGNVGIVRSSFTLDRTFALVTEAPGPLTHCVLFISSELEAFDKLPKTHLSWR